MKIQSQTPTISSRSSAAAQQQPTNPSDPQDTFTLSNSDIAKGLGVVALMAAPLAAGTLVGVAAGAAAGAVCGAVLDKLTEDDPSVKNGDSSRHAGLVTMTVAGALGPISVACTAAAAGFAVLATALDI